MPAPKAAVGNYDPCMIKGAWPRQVLLLSLIGHKETGKSHALSWNTWDKHMHPEILMEMVAGSAIASVVLHNPRRNRSALDNCQRILPCPLSQRHDMDACSTRETANPLHELNCLLQSPLLKAFSAFAFLVRPSLEDALRPRG
mmetsp:Transcript_10339/g.24606  ORF Transcript_10339/g.24606 Transcript_10339/m.24606 type:complete len:143 (-) Transcript_10339:648-1076(-)